MVTSYLWSAEQDTKPDESGRAARPHTGPVCDVIVEVMEAAPRSKTFRDPSCKHGHHMQIDTFLCHACQQGSWHVPIRHMQTKLNVCQTHQTAVAAADQTTTGYPSDVQYARSFDS